MNARKTLLLITVLFTSSMTHASPTTNTTGMPYLPEGSLGEIRYSILDESQFQEQNGTEWVALDGRKIEGSDLEKEFKWKEIPDARGVFLRSKNNGRDKTSGNPDGDLKIGQFQSDMFGTHNHTDAGHGHGHNLAFGTSDVPAHHNLMVARGNGGKGIQAPVGGSIHTGNANIQANGGNETRPRNITVNTYIKINRTKASKWGMILSLKKIMEAANKAGEFYQSSGEAFQENDEL